LRGWNDSIKGVAVGTVIGIAFGLGGFVFAEIPQTHAMGPVMFFLVPLAAGFAIATVTQGAQRISAAAMLATLASLVILIATGTETPLCAVLAFPFLFLGLIAGIALAYLFQRVAKLKGRGSVTNTIIFLSVPLLVFVGHGIELTTLVHPRQETVTSSIWLRATPETVWADLRSFDTLKAERPILMFIGLPTPVRCSMEGSGVGAKRTCYFDHGGYIEETVTEWDPPTHVRYSIDRTNLPGRHWLGFEDAAYDLRQDNGGTVLTRRTNIISNLYPASYWRPFERWGVASEHEYIFGDLVGRLNH
jgi:Polyketide cyclase / dehydrase and lipid transport